MDLPNSDTVKIIEERKKYLLQKSEKSAGKNGYELRELKALDRIINLINLFQNTVPEDTKTAADETDYDILQSYEREITNNSKLGVSFIKTKNTSKEYILLEQKKYKANQMKWAYQGKISLTPIILEEILRKTTELA